MYADAWEVALREEPVELIAAGDLGDEDHDLVELEDVKEVVELAVLLGLSKLDVVLLEAVEGQLGVVIDIDLLCVFVASSEDGVKGGAKRRVRRGVLATGTTNVRRLGSPRRFRRPLPPSTPPPSPP